ncbi:MAG: DUF4198 domain-containing protein [Pseudomonadota bacterium]
MIRIRPALLAAAIAAITIPAALSAHRLWIVPSTTVVSGADSWVTFDAAASNDLFYPDHQPLRAEPAVIAPDGSAGKVVNFAIGKYRSTFDVQIDRPGTWKLALVTAGVTGSYMLDGKEQRLPRGTTAAALATAIPAGATEVKLAESTSRNEVFVTSGAPTDTVLKGTGQGLEFAPLTHPNDLTSRETATFGFTIDGKPAPGLTVTIIAGGSRYRETTGEMTLKTDAKGQVAVTWPGAGMYWLNTTATGASATIPNAAKRMSYTATLEVLGG